MDEEQRSKLFDKANREEKNKKIKKEAAIEKYLVGKLELEQMSQEELEITYDERYSCGDLTNDEMNAA